MDIHKWLVALFIIASASSVNAFHISIDYEVTGKDNLYYTDWGHRYNQSRFALFSNMLGRGSEAGHVGYAFASGQSLDVTATSCVRDAFRWCTNADGFNFSFHGLDAFSMIGIWSESATEIQAVGSAFTLGSSISLVAPESAGSLYLFLGENDGYFADNYSSDHYHVNITTMSTPSAVPVPAAVWLFGSGLFGLLGFCRRNRQIKSLTA